VDDTSFSKAVTRDSRAEARCVRHAMVVPLPRDDIRVTIQARSHRRAPCVSLAREYRRKRGATSNFVQMDTPGARGGEKFS
jgi:hypothetical protein